MMKAGLISGLCVFASVAAGQSNGLVVDRPALDHEVVQLVTVDALPGPDRGVVAAFLAGAKGEEASFHGRVRSACPELLRGDISVAEFAAHLDTNVDAMTESLEASYQEMRDELSAAGRTGLQTEIERSRPTVAVARAVDLAEKIPWTAERSFMDFCENGPRERPQTGAGAE